MDGLVARIGVCPLGTTLAILLGSCVYEYTTVDYNCRMGKVDFQGSLHSPCLACVSIEHAEVVSARSVYMKRCDQGQITFIPCQSTHFSPPCGNSLRKAPQMNQEPHNNREPCFQSRNISSKREYRDSSTTHMIRCQSFERAF